MSTRDDDDDRDYEVGYGRPPKATQFKQGQSGNPRGRPKASKNVGTMLEEVFFQKIPITEKGVRREVTVLEAILRQLVNGALKGEVRQLDRVLKLLPVLQEYRSAAEAAHERGDARNPAADMAVLEALAEMVGSDADQLFASLQGGLEP